MYIPNLVVKTLRWSDVHTAGTHLFDLFIKYIYILYIYVMENISVFIFYYFILYTYYIFFLIFKRDTIKPRACNLNLRAYNGHDIVLCVHKRKKRRPRPVRFE